MLRSKAYVAPLLLGVALFFQGWFWHSTKGLRPDLPVMPPVPSQASLEASALGDHQFLYRNWVLRLQNAGDTGGRTTPLSAYPSDKVIGWLDVLVYLDPVSDYHISLAARYFSQSQNKEDARPIVNWMREHIRSNPKRKIPWITYAVYLARDRLDDLDLALEIAEEGVSYEVPNRSIVVEQLPAFVLFDMGRFEAALTAMQRVYDRRAADVRQEERNYMNWFMDEARAKMVERETLNLK